MYAVLIAVPVPVAARTAVMASAVPRTTRRVMPTRHRPAWCLITCPRSSPAVGTSRGRPARPVRTGSRQTRAKAVTSLASPSTQTSKARLRAARRTIRTTVMIRVRSRRGLSTPPSPSRDGTAIAIAIPSRRATALTYNSPAGSVPPGGDGPLVEPEGRDERWQGAAVTEQGQHEGHQVGGLLEAIERRAAGLGESASAGSAAVAPLLLAVHADVAEAELPPGGAVGVVAELVLRVHRCSSRGTI